MNMITRREILKTTAAGAFLSATPSISFANAATEARLVLVILRGAADGLAIAAPYGDGNYSKVRGELALSKPGQDGGLLRLDELFGLHPSLTNVYDEYQKDRATIVHAIASPYRDRSHFDGQDVLENGGSSAGLLRDGWLNRALAPLDGSLGNEPAIALAQNTPLVLRGENSVTSWAPSQLPDADENTIRRIQGMYAEDEFFATRLAQALKSQEIAAGNMDMDSPRRRGNDAQQTIAMAQATAKFLTTENGPRIAVLEAGGWDTHANQGSDSGALANRLSGMDDGLAALRDGMGEQWSNTIVAVVTEFGRTVHVNGTRGTDHGTATAAILLGGALQGGKVIADWPGLAKKDLHEGRDLRATLDTRSLFKGLLADHLQIPNTMLERSVFPNSTEAPPLRDLVKS
jgi:uncharacterized protein (DUF1501 family)